MSRSVERGAGQASAVGQVSVAGQELATGQVSTAGRTGGGQPASAVDEVSLEAELGCAQEPIRIPGSIQPHGVLLAVTEPELVVTVASANAGELFGQVPGGTFEGVRLADLLDDDALAALRAGLAGDLTEVNPLRTRVQGAEVDVAVHRVGGLLVTEWEPLAGGHQAGSAWHRRLPVVLQRLQSAATVEELARVLASDVRMLTGFDRVMVYRFDPEWNGEVLAEDRPRSRTDTVRPRNSAASRSG